MTSSCGPEESREIALADAMFPSAFEIVLATACETLRLLRVTGWTAAMVADSVDYWCVGQPQSWKRN